MLGTASGQMYWKANMLEVELSGGTREWKQALIPDLDNRRNELMCVDYNTVSISDVKKISVLYRIPLWPVVTECGHYIRMFAALRRSFRLLRPGL